MLPVPDQARKNPEARCEFPFHIFVVFTMLQPSKTMMAYWLHRCPIRLSSNSCQRQAYCQASPTSSTVNTPSTLTVQIPVRTKTHDIELTSPTCCGSHDSLHEGVSQALLQPLRRWSVLAVPMFGIDNVNGKVVAERCACRRTWFWLSQRIILQMRTK
jgi:hypothetical protein